MSDDLDEILAWAGGPKARPAKPLTSRGQAPPPSKAFVELPAVIRYRMEKESDIKKRVRRDYITFLQNYFGVKNMPFHDKIWQGVLGFGDDRYAKDRLPQPPFGRWVVMLPTEHAKSTLLNVLFPLMSLMEDENAAHCLIAANDREASRWLGAVKREIETNVELVRDFPWLKKPLPRSGMKWNESEITISGRSSNNANPSYVALGWKAKDLKGRRAKTVEDDLEGSDTSLSMRDRENLYNKHQLEFSRFIEDEAMGARHPIMVAAGTPFSEHSFYFRLEEDHGWKVFKQPYRYADGSLIWPAKAKKIAGMKEALKHDPRQFAIAMKLDPAAGDPNAMSRGQYKELVLPSGKVQAPHFRFVCFDPAGGNPNPYTDYAGISVVKIFWPEGEAMPGSIEVFRPIASKGSHFDRVHLVAKLAEEFQCPVIYENNGDQKFLYKSLFEQLYPGRIKLVEHHTSEANKFAKDGTGLTIIKAFAKDGVLKIIEDGADDLGIRALKEELKSLGLPKVHDHICAGIWFAFLHVYSHRRRQKAMSRAPSLPNHYRRFGYGQRGLVLPTIRESNG